MISKISKINDFGIYNKYFPESGLYDFEKFNLIYGWNGSGKSTLSKLFYSIYAKKLPIEFKNGEYEIVTNNGSNILSNSLNAININISVFNEEFIRENIDWNNLVKSLLYISKGKVEDKEELNLKSNALSTIEIKINQLVNLNENISNENEDSRKNIAKHIKTQLEAVRSDQTKKLFYDIRNFTKLIDDTPNLKKSKFLVSDKKLKDHKDLPELEYLDPVINFKLEKIDILEIHELIKDVNLILKKDLLLDSLKSISPIESNWIEQGLHLHENSKKCKFCNNALDPKRIKSLQKRYTQNFYDTKKEIETLIEKLDAYKIENREDYDNLNLYPFLNQEFLGHLNILKTIVSQLDNYFTDIEKILNHKYENIFEKITIEKRLNKKIFQEYNKKTEELNFIINRHNQISNDFHQRTSEAHLIYELYYGQRELKRINYFEKEKRIVENLKLLNELLAEKIILANKIKILESSLKDEVLGAAEFNTKLHRFLNHSDISLEFDSTNSGYRIIRKKGRNKEIAQNLSEGEKTAISFVFFMTKIQEDKDKLKKSIVVIDDPISSFDSNHLFNAYSFIRNICNEVEQLFVMTHNFAFFRLVRDWIKEKNKKNADGSIKYNFRIYNLVNEYTNHERRCKIVNADKTLLDYNSEYHYLFSRLYSFKEPKKIELNECFLISNMTRKILEIFLNFKFPKKRSDFMTLLTVALPLEKDRIRKEKIYRFINKYSHGDKIESFDDTIDNVINESNNIVKDVLYLIKKLDLKHYNELVEISIIT
jgi:wobble nucleotide-excising tRNase